MLRVGKLVFPREEHTIWLASTQWSALKTYMQAKYRLISLKFMYLGIYIKNTYMNETINEKRGHDVKESKEKHVGEFKGRK